MLKLLLIINIISSSWQCCKAAYYYEPAYVILSLLCVPLFSHIVTDCSYTMTVVWYWLINVATPTIVNMYNQPLRLFCTEIFQSFELSKYGWYDWHWYVWRLSKILILEIILNSSPHLPRHSSQSSQQGVLVLVCHLDFELMEYANRQKALERTPVIKARLTQSTIRTWYRSRTFLLCPSQQQGGSRRLWVFEWAASSTIKGEDGCYLAL